MSDTSSVSMRLVGGDNDDYREFEASFEPAGSELKCIDLEGRDHTIIISWKTFRKVVALADLAQTDFDRRR